MNQHVTIYFVKEFWLVPWPWRWEGKWPSVVPKLATERRLSLSLRWDPYLRYLHNHQSTTRSITIVTKFKYPTIGKHISTCVYMHCILHVHAVYYFCLLFFQPFLNMGEASNKIIGKLKVGSDTLATLEGHWDQDIYIRDRSTGVCAYLCLCTILALNDRNKGITVYKIQTMVIILYVYRSPICFGVQQSR